MKTVVGIILINSKNKTLLLQKRALNKSLFPNLYGFFGGHVEEDETNKEALIREIKEELNFQLQNPKPLLKKIQNNYSLELFYEILNYTPNLELTEDEGTLHWVSYEQAMNLELILGNKEILQEYKIQLKI